jgi:ATP-dependent DNA helicase PIF1
MIVCGTAGTGKSYLISAIANTLGEACILTGTTGMASFNICGTTIHSLLTLPVHRNTQQELRGASLQRLQRKLNGKQYLIIDEMSMIGHRMFAWIDKRLKQASAKLDSVVGGFSVILFGDFGQLPPVGDHPLYARPKSNQHCTDGYHVYLTFNTVVILDQVLRQGGMNPEDVQFRKLLLRLRNGCVNERDWELLKKRDPSKVDCNDFEDAIRLFYDKQSVAEYNLSKLESLGKPIAKVQAIHSRQLMQNQMMQEDYTV